MKIKDIAFSGFTAAELKEIHKLAKPEDLCSADFTQRVADLVGCDVAICITPGGEIGLIKMRR